MKNAILASFFCLVLAACANVSVEINPTPTTVPASPTAIRATATIVVPTTAPASQVGYLTGHMNIGPLSPVQRVGVTPVVPPEAYAARTINVMQADGITLVVNVKINSDGNYRVALPPGIYVVTLARSGMDRARELPQKISIENGKTVQLDIDIDTGIR